VNNYYADDFPEGFGEQISGLQELVSFLKEKKRGNYGTTYTEKKVTCCQQACRRSRPCALQRETGEWKHKHSRFAYTAKKHYADRLPEDFGDLFPE